MELQTLCGKKYVHRNQTETRCSMSISHLQFIDVKCYFSRRK